MHLRHFLLGCSAALLASCSGVDRSGEEPFKPVVRTVQATVTGSDCLLEGEILSSPNSSILGCGFHYGNDTLRVELKDEEPASTLFEQAVRGLEAGTYYAVAFATNGMGTAYGDTLLFTIP